MDWQVSLCMQMAYVSVVSMHSLWLGEGVIFMGASISLIMNDWLQRFVFVPQQNGAEMK